MEKSINEGLNIKVFNKYVQKMKITPFENFVYRRLENIYYCGATASIILKYLNFNGSIENKLDLRCIFLTMALNQSSILSGNINYFKDFDESPHYWVETFDSVYDPTLLFKFKKDVFYKLFSPSNIFFYNRKDYVNKVYLDIMNTTLKDINTDIVKRVSFCTMIPVIEELQLKSGNIKFRRELDYLKKSINYHQFYVDNADENISKLILK